MSVIAAQSGARPVEVVLVQDGVFADIPAALTVCVNDDDVAARGIDTPHRRVSYDEIAKMVCDAACVTVW
jgi:sulfur transfer complex TusBCD TusB component (DsrH family)